VQIVTAKKKKKKENKMKNSNGKYIGKKKGLVYIVII